MKARHTFAWPNRVIHWLMAGMILAMLFIGVGMVTSLSARHQWLIGLHKPLGIAILILVPLRLWLRWRNPPPALPADLALAQRFAAKASHWLLYALMALMPLVGWAMVSASGFPIKLGAGVFLPPLIPANPLWYPWLREAHEWLAYLLFITVVVHLGAALYHGLIRRDGVLRSMTTGQEGD